VAEDLLSAHQHEIDSLTLTPSRGGVFEVDVDGFRVFSKSETGRHTSSEEVLALLAQRLEDSG
jgi:selenoprotein W-related protein